MSTVSPTLRMKRIGRNLVVGVGNDDNISRKVLIDPNSFLFPIELPTNNVHSTAFIYMNHRRGASPNSTPLANPSYVQAARRNAISEQTGVDAGQKSRLSPGERAVRVGVVIVTRTRRPAKLPLSHVCPKPCAASPDGSIHPATLSPVTHPAEYGRSVLKTIPLGLSE